MYIYSFKLNILQFKYSYHNTSQFGHLELSSLNGIKKFVLLTISS